MLYLKSNQLLNRGEIFKAFDTQYRIIAVGSINNQILYDIEELDTPKRSTVVLKGYSELVTITEIE